MGSFHIEALETLLHTPDRGREPEIKAAIARLASEVKERISRGSPGSTEFVTSALRALCKVKGHTHAELRMACLFESGLYFFSNGLNQSVLEIARHLAELAKMAKSKNWQRKAHTLFGIAHADMANAAEAVQHYASAFNHATELDDTLGQISVLGNLGNALNYAGLYREAIPCFRRAISLVTVGLDSKTWEAPVYCNLAQSYAYLGEYELAFEAICNSLSKSGEPTIGYEALQRNVREFTCVQISLELGKIAVAREHALLCEKYARQSGSARGEIHAVIATALCEVHGGRAERGLLSLEKSLRLIRPDLKANRADLLSALVKANDHAGQPEVALEYLRELVQHISSTRSASVVALLALPRGGSIDVSVLSDSRDMHVLRTHEAELRARVAEREVVSSRIEMLERLAITADVKEEATGEHGYRVGKLSALLAEELQWTREASYAIDLAARLHDIGKVAVPDRILLNSEKLKEAERHFMSTHTIIGAELLAKSNVPQLKMAEEIARYHHEWWNGEGYPSKLAGKRIPIHARIVALADVFDALTHGRPFAEPWPIERAIDEIKTRKGTQFDPELTDVFLALIERLRKEHEDLDEYLGRAGRNSPFLQARNKIRSMLSEEREQEKKATLTGNATRH